MSGMSDARSGRAPRRDAVRNDKRVLEAARDVFSESGLQASMEDIAARAGVGVGTIYRRFPSKVALLDALAEQISIEMEAAVTDALADPDAGHGLEAFLEFVGDFNVAKLRYSADLVARVGEDGASDAMVAMVEELTAKAVSAGALATDVTATDILALIKAMRGVVTTATGDRSAAWRRFLRMHLAGLRTEPN